MTIDDIIGKFLDDEALLDGGNVAVTKVVAELGEEGVTVYRNAVTNVQNITRHVLAAQRVRATAEARLRCSGVAANPE